jgi:hypothetical protein
MRNTLYVSITVLLLQACGSEKQEPATTDSTATDTTMATTNLDTTGVYKYHGGSWYDNNKNHPYFNSMRVDALVAKKKLYQPEETDEIPMDYDVDYLEKNELEELTTRELIYYCIAFKNSFSQICAGDVFSEDSTNTVKIEANLPFDYSALLMSITQKKALEARKDSVVQVLTEYILANDDKIEMDYLDILADLHAVKAIPAIISTASLKNRYNYTLLLTLMNDMKYQPLMDAPFYENLYGDEAYRNNMHIEATPETIKMITDLARNFYKGEKGS